MFFIGLSFAESSTGTGAPLGVGGSMKRPARVMSPVRPRDRRLLE